MTEKTPEPDENRPVLTETQLKLACYPVWLHFTKGNQNACGNLDFAVFFKKCGKKWESTFPWPWKFFFF